MVSLWDVLPVVSTLDTLPAVSLWDWLPWSVPSTHCQPVSLWDGLPVVAGMCCLCLLIGGRGQYSRHPASGEGVGW